MAPKFKLVKLKGNTYLKFYTKRVAIPPILIKLLEKFVHRIYYKVFFLLVRPVDPPDPLARPRMIRLEAASVCQLRCPSCPTTKGIIRKSTVGAKLLKFDDFKKLVDENPWIEEIELSNWGEIFLNPDLSKILKYAYEKTILLQARNGVHFNDVKDEILEALVKYKFKHLTCSIDGATPETYAKYRVRGDFDRVIGNIQRLNHYKKIYNSFFPSLCWKFILFEHNKHELEAARSLAHELNMEFHTTLSWDQKLAAKNDGPKSASMENASKSPSISDKHAKGQNIEDPPPDVDTMIEDLEKNQDKHLKTLCYQLWTEPQINSDMKILGCCVNYWGDFGNGFDSPNLLEALNNEKMVYARKMLAGQVQEKDGIPCTTCHHYHRIRRKKDWVTKRELESWEKVLLARRSHNPCC